MTGIQRIGGFTPSTARVHVQADVPARRDDAERERGGSSSSNAIGKLALGLGVTGLLAVGVGLIARHGGASSGAWSKLAPIGAAITGASLLTACSNYAVDGREVPHDEAYVEAPVAREDQDRYEQELARYESEHAAWTEAKQALDASLDEVLATGASIPGVTGERAGSEDRLVQLPVSTFTEQWNSATDGRSTSTTSSRTDGGSASSHAGRSVYTAADLSRAISESHARSSGGVWSDQDIVTLTESMSSSAGNSEGMVWTFEGRTRGTSLGLTIGTRSYDSIEHALANLVAARDIRDGAEGPVAIVETPDGLRTVEVDAQFEGVDAYAPILITHPDVRAIVVDDNVFEPTRRISNLADDRSDGARVFEYRGKSDAIAALGTSTITRMAEEPIEPTRPTGTWPKAERGPAIDSPWVGSVEIRDVTDPQGTTNLRVKFEDGHAVAGFASREGAEHYLQNGDNRVSGIVFEIDGNWYAKAIRVNPEDTVVLSDVIDSAVGWWWNKDRDIWNSGPVQIRPEE